MTIIDYRARYYDPSEGRFLSEDPIGFKGKDINLYRYVTNSPIGKNDPSGNIVSPSTFCPCLTLNCPKTKKDCEKEDDISIPETLSYPASCFMENEPSVDPDKNKSSPPMSPSN